MKKAYLIGHGNMELVEFISLLKNNQIDTLVDVRSVPYSKFASQFNIENLKKEITKNNISYVYMGDTLGGRHPEGFDKYFKSEEFDNALIKLQERINISNVAIMCSEIDHTKCHRRFIGNKLKDNGICVEAIGKNGKEMICQVSLFAWGN